MNGGYRISNQTAPHFLTFTVVDWVDVFSRKTYRDIVIESLKFCIRHKGMVLYAYVIMTNHIHLIVQSEEADLSSLIRDFKKFVAQAVLKQIEAAGESRRDWMLKRFEFAATSNQRNDKRQFWQVNNHPEEIFTESFLWTKINYIHLNPVRAGWVTRASDYLYSSAANYVDRGSLLQDLTIPPNPIIDPTKTTGYNVDISLW